MRKKLDKDAFAVPVNKSMGVKIKIILANSSDF